jgi:hypothetical protein
MKRLAAAVAVLAFASIASISGAQAKPSFAGKWILSSGDLGWWGKEFTATQDAKILSVTRRTASGAVTTHTYNLDGSDSKHTTSVSGQTVEQLSKVKWDGSSLIMTTTYKARVDVEATQTWSLDASGTLTVALLYVQGGEPVKGKSVYKKSSE